MGIAEDVSRAKYVAPTERFGGRFLEILAHRLAGVGNDIPWLRHDISRIICPGRTPQVIAPGKVFRCSSAKCCPSTLLFRRILRHLYRVVQETLTTIDSIQEECVHKIANSHAKSFLARS